MIWGKAVNACQSLLGQRQPPGDIRAATPLLSYTDIHCHCLPRLDDGPTDMDGAIALCKALAVDGAETVVATPHQLGRYDLENTASRIRAGVESLNTQLQAVGVPLSVVPGADVRIDERIGELLDQDLVLTLADSWRYILLELPHHSTFDPDQVLQTLADRGICPVLTHPERHPEFQNSTAAADRWQSWGAVLQVTAGSLLGDFGGKAKHCGWRLIGESRVGVLATDSHDTDKRPPRMTRAAAAISAKYDYNIAHQLCVASPARMLNGFPIRQAIV